MEKRNKNGAMPWKGSKNMKIFNTHTKSTNKKTHKKAKKLTSMLLTLAMLAGLLAAAPIASFAVDVSSGAQFLEAIENAPSGDYAPPSTATTIRLTSNVAVNDNGMGDYIWIDSKNIIIDLNGYKLSLGAGLKPNFSKLVFNGDLTVDSDWCASALFNNYSDVTINGNIIGDIQYGIESYGEDINSPTITTVNGNITVSRADYSNAIYCWGGDIVVHGNLSGINIGLQLVGNSTVTVYGTVKGSDYSVHNYGYYSEVDIKESVTGRVLFNAGKLIIGGNVYSHTEFVPAGMPFLPSAIPSAGAGIGADDLLMRAAGAEDYTDYDALVSIMDSEAEISGSIYATGDDKVGLWAEYGALVSVGGNISVGGGAGSGEGLGVYVGVDSDVTVEGSIDADTPYLCAVSGEITVNDNGGGEPDPDPDHDPDPDPDPGSNDPYITITGPASVETGAGATATYTISAANMPAINGIELIFEVDGDYLASKEFNAKSSLSLLDFGNYGMPIYWTNVGNIWIGKATLLDMPGINGGTGAGESGDFDILEMVFNVYEGVLGDAVIKLTKITLSFSGANIEADIVDGAVTTAFTEAYSIYDLNKDRVVDLNDLTYALQYLGVSLGDPEWPQASLCNFDDSNNVIDINDLIIILANYTVPYYS